MRAAGLRSWVITVWNPFVVHSVSKVTLITESQHESLPWPARRPVFLGPTLLHQGCSPPQLKTLQLMLIKLGICFHGKFKWKIISLKDTATLFSRKIIHIIYNILMRKKFQVCQPNIGSKTTTNLKIHFKKLWKPFRRLLGPLLKCSNAAL